RRSTAACATPAPRCARAAASCWRTSSGLRCGTRSSPSSTTCRTRPASPAPAAVPVRAPLARAAPVYRPAALGYDDLLARLIEEPGETVRCLAVYHVGELGLSARPHAAACVGGVRVAL